MKITVLGCGRWGGFIAWYFATIKKYDVFSWGPKGDKIFEALKKTHKNEYLTMPKNVLVSDDLELALKSEIIVISISSQRLAGFAKRLNEYDIHGKTIILAMKGVESSSGKRLTQVIKQEIKQDISLAVWVGPGHVQSFTKMIPNCMVICSENNNLTKNIVEKFESPLIRYYYGTDLIGNEIGAAAKNVIGLAAGMLDGLGLVAMKGALMARGAREVSRLIKVLGGNEITAYGLCHLGDYEATLFSENSHNRAFGQMIVEGKKFGKLAEGVDTSQALLLLGEKYKVDLPIIKAVNQIVNGEKDPQKAIEELFLRPLKREF